MINNFNVIFNVLVFCFGLSSVSSQVMAAGEKNPSLLKPQKVTCQPTYKFQNEDGISYQSTNFEFTLTFVKDQSWDMTLYDITDQSHKILLDSKMIHSSLLKQPISEDLIELVTFVLDIKATEIESLEFFPLADQGDDATGASFFQVYSEVNGARVLAGQVFQMGWGAGICKL